MSQLVELRSYPDAMVAEADRAALEGAGIFCALENVRTVQNDWLITQAVGGVSLKVRREDWAVARALLTPIEEGEAQRARPLSQKEALVERFVMCVAIGILFGPLQYYAFFLLLRLASLPGEIRREMRRKYLLAAWLNVVLMLGLTAMVIAIAVG